jgi:hypothetical protein
MIHAIQIQRSESDGKGAHRERFNGEVLVALVSTARWLRWFLTTMRCSMMFRR